MQLRSLIAVCALLALLSLAAVLWSRYGRQPGEGVVAPAQREPRPQPEGTGLIVVKPPSGVGEKDEAGNWVWEAQFAGELNVDEESGTVTGSQVMCTIPMEDDQVLVVTALGFRADRAARSLSFQQEARAELKPLGSYFLADAFDWSIDEQRLSAQGGVEVAHQHARLTGDKLEADLKARKARVRGHARAAYRG